VQKLERLVESGTYFLYFFGFLVKKEIGNSGTRTQAQKKKEGRKKERKKFIRIRKHKPLSNCSILRFWFPVFLLAVKSSQRSLT
jgi:hypothetical protein